MNYNIKMKNILLKFCVHTLSRRLNLTCLKFRYRHFVTSEIDNFERLILKNTVISKNHLTPELQLRLITPECKLWNCKNTEAEFENDPFWGIYWPGGQALGRYILDNKGLFHGKTVLDVGSGSGACALAAAKCGAKFVLANDTDPVSLSAVHINARLNGLTVHTDERDLIGQDVDSLVITKLLKKNKVVLVGDPGRHVLKELECFSDIASLVKIASYDLCDGEHNGFSTSSVFKLAICIAKHLTFSERVAVQVLSEKG